MYSTQDITEGTWFIDINQDYSAVKLITTGKNPKNNNALSVHWYNFPDEPTITELKDFTGIPFPDLNGTHTELYGRFIELGQIYNKSFRQLVRMIYSNDLKRVNVNEVIKFYEAQAATSAEGEALLKLSIATGRLKFENQKGGDFIKLPEHTVLYENKKRFLQAISDEIIAKSQRVELLIQHNQTKGNYRELLVRRILKKYLPTKYEVATGFIEGCKRQCDIIIYDSINFSPFFREDDLVVVPQKSVRAVIEVKSTLDTNQLNDALDLLWEVARHRGQPAPFFKGIFAFKKGYESEKSITDAICSFYHRPSELTALITNDILELHETINSICVVNAQCVISDIIDYKLQDTTVRPRFYSVHSDNEDLKLYSAAFFSELFSFLDVDKHAKKVNLSYFNSLDNEIRYKLEGELYDKDWKPSSAFVNEHNFDFDSIWTRASDVVNWKTGRLTTQELEEKYQANQFKPVNFLDKFKK